MPSGSWKGPSSAAADGVYFAIGSYSGTFNGYNSSSKAIQIQAMGGTCGNRFDLRGSVSGFGLVAYSTTANPDWGKGTSITFMVPSKTSYTITSYPYSCGAGSFSIVSFVLT